MAPRRSRVASDRDQRPTFEHVPRFKSTSGPEVVELAGQCGIDLMGYQRHVCRGSLGETKDGLWSAPEVAIILSRQNGKGTFGEARVLGGLALFDERLIFWTAHLVPTALEAMTRLLSAIDNNDDLRGQVKSISRVNGREGFELFGTSRRTRITQPRRVRFAARTGDSLRGFAGADLLVLDEAYKLTGNQAAAIGPTLATTVNPQTLYLSSPPLDTSPYGPKREEDATAGLPLFALRKRAHDRDPFLAYFEWGIDENLDEVDEINPDTGGYVTNIDDDDALYRTNPALGHILQVRSVAAERGKLSRRAYARERLGAWPVAPVNPSSDEARVLKVKTWANCRVSCLDRGENDLSLGVDTSPTQSKTSIMAYWAMPDGSEAAELVEQRPGIAWLPLRLRDICDTHLPRCVALDRAGQLGAAIHELTAVGFRVPDTEDPYSADGPRFGDLWLASTAQVAAATSGAVEVINGGRARHGGQVELSTAVAGVKLRSIGQGMSAFGRRVSTSDITPIIGWSLARQGHRERDTVVRFDPYAATW